MKNRFGVLLALMTVTVSQTASAQTANIVADLDNTLYYDVTGAVSNGLGTQMIVGQTRGLFGTMVTPRRGLTRYNVAAFVPPGATIVSAELNLSAAKTNNGPQSISLHRVNANAQWGEGNSNASAQPGQGDISAPGDATWLHRKYPDTLWTSIGADGDYNPTASQSSTVFGLGLTIWSSNAAMVADVQHWLDNPSENNGWILIGNEIDTATTVALYTKDYFSPSDKPTLIVNFLPPVSVSDDGGDRPRDFTLSQNYPNPFNPATTIEYTLERAAAVSLIVYDLTGRRVQTLENRVHPAGRHKVSWDGTNEAGETVGSGLYFYALDVEGVTTTKKMVLIR